MTAQQSIRLNSLLRAEINVPCPAEGDAYRQLARDWFMQAVGPLAGALGDGFGYGLDLTARALANNGSGPYGAPGTLWASFYYDETTRRGQRPVETYFSPAHWQEFLRQLGNRPLVAQLQLALIDDEGQPGEPWLEVSVTRDDDAPGVVSLVAVRTTEEFENPATADDAQQRWESFLRDQVERHGSVLYASVADDADYITGRTALEDGLGLLLGDTLPELETTLRGYGWLTVCSPGVLTALGGVPALRAGGAFAEVAPLPGGGAWLKATDRIHAYTEARVRAVFEALAPVLPPGKPVPSIASETSRLVYETPKQ
ncbi:hypothetical protein AB0Q95_39000 [Streptomyces sp. NPDC059900]|uniref:hypothetical protein n=1 Tax=Streptomyces sp. NPDC059900 TaxID=3155816 RepID=UPI0034348A76